MMRLVLLLATFIVGCSNPGSEEVLTGPISAELSNVGAFAIGQSWEMNLNEDRTLIVNIWGTPSDDSRTFTVTSKQIEDLRVLLGREKFFELENEYGELVPEGSVQTLTIRCGNKSKSVKLHYLGNWARQQPERLADPARAIRVWRYMRTWFEDSRAVDLREYDYAILEAAEK